MATNIFPQTSNPFSATFVAHSKFYGDQEREQKLAALLNESKASRLIKDIPNCPISPKVSVGRNFAILNYKPNTQTQEEGDPDIIKAALNIVTESALGNIHAESGFQMSAFNKMGTSDHIKNFGATKLTYTGKYLEFIDGLGGYTSKTEDPDFDKVKNNAWVKFDLMGGRFVVTGLLKKIPYVGDTRTMPDEIRINNFWVTKVIALDLLLTGKPMFCYFSDSLAAYVAEKWNQFDLDMKELLARKNELITNFQIKKEQAKSYGVIAAAQNDTPEGEATKYPMPSNIVKIVLGGKIVEHVLVADGTHPVVPNMEYDQWFGQGKARNTITIGDDDSSRSRMSVLAAKFYFAPHQS